MKKQKLINRAITTFVVLSVVLILGPAKSGIAGKHKGEDNSGSVWEVLQAEGLTGDHYTLNIHGEYGNNIFMPSNSEGTSNQILIVSGKGKGSKKDMISAYGVRDTCTNEFDGDAAEVVLPPNDKGYFVVARVLGKPTDNPYLGFKEGALMFVEDEFGNDLLVLGLVTNGFWKTPHVELTRTKGKTTAVDITGLFLWSGSVCYFDPANYCTVADPCDETKELCCTDNDSDGYYEDCTDPVSDALGNLSCADAGYVLMTLGCQNYVDKWVFNIGDYVGAEWETYAGGNFKLANIRFYPVK